MPKTKKPRTDKRKNIGKVAAILAEDPHATEREIARQTGMGNGTAHRAKNELEQNGAKDPTITYIIKSSKKNLKNISKANLAMTKAIINEFCDYDADTDEYTIKQGKDLKELTSYLSRITQIGKDDLQRITVLGGNMTNRSGGLKSIRELMFDQDVYPNEDSDESPGPSDTGDILQE